MSRTILTSLFKKMPLRKGLVEHGMKFVCWICFLLKSLVFPSYCLQWCLMDVKQLVINFWSKTFSEQLILSLIWIWEPPIGRKERSNTHHIALRADLLSSFNPCTFCMLDVAGNPSNTDSFYFFFDRWFRRAGFLLRRQTPLTTRLFSARKQVIHLYWAVLGGRWEIMCHNLLTSLWLM